MKTFLTFVYGSSDVLVKGKYIQNVINLLVKGEFKFEFYYQCSYLKSTHHFYIILNSMALPDYVI